MSLLDFFISPAAAQAAPAAAGPSPFGNLALVVGMCVIMYFLMIRPQMKRQKEHRDLISKLAVGDEVITNSGIAGRVREMGENFIMVEIADGVQVKMQRGAITAVLPRDTLKSA